MANLVDTSVNGDLRVTGTMFGTQAGNYATCATTAGTAAKAVTISGFTLTTGIHVFVKFTVTNTAAVASLTLNVSGTGAKSMKYRGGNLPAVGTLSANRVYEFIYDGTNWELVGDLDTNTQTVTGVKGNAESSYRTGQVNLTAANIGASASDHTHGNIGNGGTLTDTAAAAAGNDYVVIRDADNNKVQTSTIKGTDVAEAVSKKHSHSTLTLSTTAQAYDGTHTLALPSTDPYTSARTPTSHASSATTYGVGTTANYGHVKLDNSTPLTVGTTSTDGVATGKAHVHNAIESVARSSVTTPDLAHINTNTRVHMVLSQISNDSGTTHDPGDGYMLTFMWDTSAPYDSQLFIPGGDDSGHDFGRLRVRYRNNGSWGDWGYLGAAFKTTLLTSSDNLNNIKGDGFGNIMGYRWESTSTPSNTPFTDNHGAELLVFGTSGTDFCIQVELRASKGIYQRRLSSGTWGSWEKVLVTSDIATGTANGTISVAGTDVAVKGLGGAAYLNTGTASGTVATGNHTHTTSIASDSSSGTVVALAHDTQYKLTAGGTSVLFKTPADSNTDTKVKATAKTDNVNYKVLATASASPTSGNATEAIYDTDISLNPSTNTITANVSGNAATATKPKSTLLNNTHDLDTIKGSSQGDFLTYHWTTDSVPANAPVSTATSMMQVYKVHSGSYLRQVVYVAGGEVYSRTQYNGTWDPWAIICKRNGMPYLYYTMACLKGTTSTNKYKLLGTITSYKNTQDHIIAAFRVDFVKNNGKQDYADLIVTSVCTNADTPTYTYNAEMLRYGTEVDHLELKLYANAAGNIELYAYAPGATSNDWGHLGIECLYMTRLYSLETIDNYLKLETAGSTISGSAPSGTEITITTTNNIDSSDVTSTYSSTGTSPVNGTAVAAAIGGLDVSSVGGDGKYISAISETDGKISATATTMDTTPTASSTKAVTSGGIKTALDKKVDIANVNLDSQSTTILAQVQSMASSQIHYKRFYTSSDGGSANISDKPTGTTNGGFMLEAYCNRYVSASDWRYVVLCYVQATKPKIAWIKSGDTSISWQDLNTNTDTKVTQTADDSSTGTGFEVLFSATADNTTRTEASRKSSKLTFQPSTGTLTATKFSGPLTGNVTGNCSGSSGSCTGNAATASAAQTGSALETAINGKSPTSHTHTVKINGTEKTIAATGGTAVDLGTYLTAHQTIKQDGVTGATVNRFGTCSTEAATAAKTVSITTGTYTLEAGATVAVKFANKNTANSPTLNVGSTGAKNIFVNGAQITSGSNKGMLAGTVVFIYDGTQYNLIGNYYDSNSTYSGMVDAYLNNAADAAKSASSTNFKLSSGTTIMLANNVANTKNAALTLNVNGTGAKTLYINGSPSSASNYTIPVGTFPCYYDGTNWWLWTDGTFQVDQLRYNAILGEHQAKMRYHIQVNNTGSSPKGWCSILRVTKTSDYGSYTALRVHGILYDGNGNWEYQQERRIEFQAIVNLTSNTANLYLGKTTLTADNWIRLVKVADRDYELQYNASTANYDLDIYYQYEGNASAYVTRYTTYTATTVSGTAITSEKLLPGSIAYRADADGDGNNIKASYFKSSGNVTLVSGTDTKIGTQNGTDVKLTLPTIPAAANNGALQLQLNGGTATSKFTANQSGNSTLAFSTGSTAGTFKVDSTEIAIAGFTKVEASSTNGKIKINGTDTTVYTHPTTEGNKHIPSGGSSGQFLGYDSAGTAKWVNNPNTDTKQRIVASDSKTYLTGVTTAPTSSNQDLTGVANTNVYATAGQLHATTFDVNSKCTLQFNTTTNALDFVFA